MPAIALDAPSRLAGVDLARGLAVLGMLTAHLIDLPDLVWGDPSTWLALADGRSSIVFATLAGVSIGLMTGGAVRPGAGGLVTAGKRIAVRAVILLLLGVMLIATGVPVYVILPAYALLFVLALPLLALRARTLWVIAGVTALAMPWLQPVLDAPDMWQTVAGNDLALLIGWHYPFTVWFTFLVAGLAAARSDLRRTRTQVALALGGAAAALAAYGADAVGTDPGGYLGEVWTAQPHSSGLLEVIGSGGWALLTIGLCLLVCRTAVRWVVLPLRAVGSMPLTVYVGQIVVWAIVAAVVLGDTGDLDGFRALELLGPFLLTTLVACTAWALLLGRGPLERGIAALTSRIH
ncbi:DUF1624 domain-containing protein [Microbacterium sp. W1N]|uniref:DUF1624 domain-containing protein n=1 Tax=Microbacterium festucae TaxID=2977531 RepID=UPI0021BF6A96|nr:DUF1624 domain-containing protein [Microbacterium festucae]MCT9821455.1 DUF1624 domain-containing protein [Microbacterium festucae]